MIQHSMTTETPATQADAGPGLLLRLEGLATLVASIAAYAHLGGNGWLFLALLLAPDVSMLGYLRGPHMGAWLYNLFHAYLLPGGLLAAALALGWESGALLALIWLAHIGMDRAVGYGLKYATHFKDTHLSRV